MDNYNKAKSEMQRSPTTRRTMNPSVAEIETTHLSGAGSQV
jgi:hypothetical protein